MWVFEQEGGWWHCVFGWVSCLGGLQNCNVVILGWVRSVSGLVAAVCVFGQVAHIFWPGVLVLW